MRRAALALLGAALLAGVAATAASASTWCGTPTATDQLPQVVPGPAVHLVYAYPSDATDRIAQFGTTMQTDIETIDGWWRGQDPTRTPRFDTFAFPCGPQLDITDLKLSNTTAELTPLNGRFERILTGLSAGGLVSRYAIYLVYYDAPDNGDNVCGEGGTNDPTNGGGVAIVFAGSCVGEPTAVTAAHEMTHALGAVFPPAPHNCAPPDDGHVCDSNRDLMYPFVDGTPLSSLLLDVGRDDYYGATGVGFDVRTSHWLRHLDEPVSHLDLVLTGSGSVASDVPGVDCSATCGTDWDGGQSVTLTATPATGMRFVRWGGGCAGEAECTLALAKAVSVTALFAPARYQLSLGVTGQGGVIVFPAGEQCRKRCKLALTSYVTETLRAAARPGWKFKRWGGACHGTRLTCTVPMTKSASATALFAKKRA